uniref:mRNA interferase MazF n=1 Tax=Candidatus Kentrum sp. DK TaxID=2126562 RepID=A0A450S3B3_9GAMM|nr:MAG: mRNA interferase MazF [Candidatus Kentron sp. DK]
MVTPSVGSVVLVPFPFSDLSTSKLRPALLVASSGRDDWVCAQITSNPYSDPSTIEICEADFEIGSLNRISYIRPGKLFTAHHVLFRRIVGKLTKPKLNEARTAIITLLQS